MSSVDMEVKCKCGAMAMLHANSHSAIEYRHCSFCGRTEHNDYLNQKFVTRGGQGSLQAFSRTFGLTRGGISLRKLTNLKRCHESMFFRKRFKGKQGKAFDTMECTRKIYPGRWEVFTAYRGGTTTSKTLPTKRAIFETQGVFEKAYIISHVHLPTRMTQKDRYSPLIRFKKRAANYRSKLEQEARYPNTGTSIDDFVATLNGMSTDCHEEMDEDSTIPF